MTNETEISLEEIKTILSNYKGLKKQIRNHISDLYDDLMDTDNLIETVSIKKTEISEMGTKGGSKKDLSDIIIRHECILKRWYREISYEIESLMKKDEKIRRVWLCYQLISEDCYEVVTKIYVEHHSSKEVMTDYIARTGETSRTFFRLVNKSLNNIKVMYESRYSNDNLLKMSLSQKKVRKNKAVTPDSSPYKQLSFGLENADETFTYTVSKEIEKNMPSTAKYSKVVIKDAVDSCLTIDSVKFYAGDKDVTSSFAPTSANKGNYLEYAASSDLLNNKDFYGNNAGTTVKMVIKTHIDAKKVSIETLRAHGHLVENDKKTETDIKIKNETTVTTTKADNQGTWDVDKKVTPPPTTTDSPVPSIKDPVKKVSDSDDLNWDATVKQDGEKTPGSHNRVTDVTNQWLYTLTQEIPAHTVELFHYKSFTITDAVDSCLSYDVKDIAIKAGDKDYRKRCPGGGDCIYP